MTDIASNSEPTGLVAIDRIGEARRIEAAPITVAAATDVAGLYGARLKISGTPHETVALEDRELRNRWKWGSEYLPPIDDVESRANYLRICDEILSLLTQVRMYVSSGELTEDGAGVAAEICDSLERLYDVRFGEGESLKMAVVAIQVQINNSIWTTRHIDFLTAAVSFLRARSLLRPEIVERIDDLAEEHELDVFRGTVSEPQVLHRYRIERIS